MTKSGDRSRSGLVRSIYPKIYILNNPNANPQKTNKPHPPKIPC